MHLVLCFVPRPCFSPLWHMLFATALLWGDEARTESTARFITRRHTKDRRNWIVSVCSLTWGWAKNILEGFVSSNASTFPHPHNTPPWKQPVFVPCWWLPLQLLIILDTLNQTIFYVCVLKSPMLSPDSGVRPTTMYFHMANAFQRTEA